MLATTQKFPHREPTNLKTRSLLEISDFLRNSGCVAITGFLGVPSPIGNKTVTCEGTHGFREKASMKNRITIIQLSLFLINLA